MRVSGVGFVGRVQPGKDVNKAAVETHVVDEKTPFKAPAQGFELVWIKHLQRAGA